MVVPFPSPVTFIEWLNSVMAGSHVEIITPAYGLGTKLGHVNICFPRVGAMDRG